MLDSLNSLLRGELAAVAGYQKALRTLREKAAADGDAFLRLASDHQRTVAALQGSVESRGGNPLTSPEPWEEWSVPALAGEVAPATLGTRGFVIALLEVERRGLSDYEKALGGLDEDARELVEIELIPRQRRHVANLSALLIQLPA